MFCHRQLTPLAISISYFFTGLVDISHCPLAGISPTVALSSETVSRCGAADARSGECATAVAPRFRALIPGGGATLVILDVRDRIGRPPPLAAIGVGLNCGDSRDFDIKRGDDVADRPSVATPGTMLSVALVPLS